MQRATPLILLILAGAGCIRRGELPGASIRVLDRGAEPRRELRYAFQPGRIHRVAVHLQSSYVSTSGGRDVDARASHRASLRVEEKSVTPEGNLRLEIETDCFELIPQEGFADPKLEKVEKEVQEALQGARLPRGYAVVSPTGLLVEGKVEEPDPEDNVNRAIVVGDLLVTALRWAQVCMCVPFPEGGIGEGAKWTLTRAGPTIEDEGTYTYSLEAMGADSLKVTMAVTYDMPEKFLKSMQDQGLTVKSLSLKVAAKMEVDLRRIILNSEMTVSKFSMGPTIEVSDGKAVPGEYQGTSELTVRLVPEDRLPE